MLRITILVSFIIIIFNQFCFSEEIEILPIIPVPDFSDSIDPDSKTKGNSFSGSGYINRIESNEVVIDDCLYKLTNLTTFHTIKGRIWDKSIFNEGNIVGYILDSPEQIASLWIVN